MNANVRSALIQGYLDAAVGLPTAYENAKFDKPTDTPWAAVFILPNQPVVASLGSSGQDDHRGIMQIDLSYPLGSGEEDLQAKVDLLCQHFTAGKRLVYNAQEVILGPSGRSGGRSVDGWFRVSVTVPWQARVSRT